MGGLDAYAWIANDLIWQAWPALLAESVAVALNLRTISRMKQPVGTLPV